MHYLLNFILLFSISITSLTVGLIDIQSIYDDMKEKNESCSFDTCSYRLNEFGRNYGCHCDENCARFGTCCLDSLFIQVARPNIKPTCRSANNGPPYFMVDRCPTSDSVWESLCREEVNSKEDILKIVPVTSLLTSVTYKNYFCFRCHETNDEFAYWKVKLNKSLWNKSYQSMSSEELQSDFEKQLYSLTYEDGKWIASFRNGLARLPLWFTVEIPQEIKPLVTPCDPSIISNCSAKWTDFEVNEKCQAYMRVRVVERGYKFITYKNLHCALCNFEDLNNIACVPTQRIGDGGPFKPYFSFSYLFDIDNPEENKVGKIQKCDDDHIWDPYARTCRKLTFAYQVQKI